MNHTSLDNQNKEKVQVDAVDWDAPTNKHSRKALALKSPTKLTTEDEHLKSSVSFEFKPLPRWLLGLLSVVIFATGSFDTIASKWMNKQELLPSPGATSTRKFEAPVFQTWTIFVGEACCLFAYYGDRWWAKRNGSKPKLEFTSNAASFNKAPCPKLLWIVPAFMDFFSSCMFQFAVIFTYASTVTILRNFNVLVCSILSIFFVKVGLRLNQMAGVGVVTIGLLLTGINALLSPDNNTNYQTDLTWVGIALTLIGTIINAAQNVVEEIMFRKYRASPLEAVGLMGLYGTILGIVVLFIFECVPGTGVEKSRETFYMMTHGTQESMILIFSNITFVISVCAYNACGLIVTKVASALLRIILMTGRTVAVYIVELILGWSAFTLLNLFGLLSVALGIFLYNYNYFFSKGSWVGDEKFRKPIMCCAWLVNPDDVASGAETGVSTTKPMRDISTISNKQN